MQRSFIALTPEKGGTESRTGLACDSFQCRSGQYFAGLMNVNGATPIGDLQITAVTSSDMYHESPRLINEIY